MPNSFETQVISQVTVLSNRNPTVTDDARHGYVHQQLWINKLSREMFICIANNNDDAVWYELSPTLRTTSIAELPSPQLSPIGQDVFVSDAEGGMAKAYNSGIDWLKVKDDSTVWASPDFGGFRMGLGVPLYMYPPLGWSTFTATGLPRVCLEVLNPNSGPGTEVDVGYAAAYNASREKRIPVLGYIPTTYGARNLDDVKADIQTYLRLYPNVSGFFFDEVADEVTSAEDDPIFLYYKAIYDYVLAEVPYPKQYVALNPGAVVAERFMGISSSICLYEDTAANYFTFPHPSWLYKHDRKKIWHIVHTVTSTNEQELVFNRARELNVGLIYATSDIMPNPYDTVSIYESELETLLSDTGGAAKIVDIPGRKGEWWGDNAVEDTGAVVSVADPSGVPHVLTVAGSGADVTKVASALNGHAALRFAAGKRLVNSSFTQGQGFTMWMVYKPTAGDIVPFAGKGGEVAIFPAGGTGYVSWYAGTFTGGSLGALGEWAIVVARFDSVAGGSKLRVNGVTASTVDPGAHGLTAVSLGDYEDGGNAFVGDIVAAGVYDRAISDDEIVLVEEYLAAQTGLTLG
jgi:hypothetical protein